MKKVTPYLFSLIIVLAVLGLAGWALGWGHRIAQRPIQQYEEETRTLTYDNSRQYQQGTNRDIARYCREMHSSETEAGKKAVAALIRSTISTYNGPIQPDNQNCVSEAKGF